MLLEKNGVNGPVLFKFQIRTYSHCCGNWWFNKRNNFNQILEMKFLRNNANKELSNEITKRLTGNLWGAKTTFLMHPCWQITVLLFYLLDHYIAFPKRHRSPTLQTILPDFPLCTLASVMVSFKLISSFWQIRGLQLESHSSSGFCGLEKRCNQVLAIEI